MSTGKIATRYSKKTLCYYRKEKREIKNNISSSKFSLQVNSAQISTICGQEKTKTQNFASRGRELTKSRLNSYDVSKIDLLQVLSFTGSNNYSAERAILLELLNRILKYENKNIVYLDRLKLNKRQKTAYKIISEYNETLLPITRPQKLEYLQSVLKYLKKTSSLIRL